MALVEEDAAYERLAAALRGDAVLERVRDHAALAESVALSAPRTAVLEVKGETLQRTAIIVRALNEHAPLTRVVLACAFTLAGLDALFRLHAPPADELIIPMAQDVGTIRRRVLERDEWRVAVRRVRDMTVGVHETLQPMFDWCLAQFEERPQRPLTVKQMARDIRHSPREIERRCRQARGVAPRDLIAWAQILLAMFLLEGPGRGLDSVAEDVGLSSARALGRLIRRKTGRSPGTIRRHDGMRFVVACFREAFSSRPMVAGDRESEVPRPPAVDGAHPERTQYAIHTVGDDMTPHAPPSRTSV